MQKVPKPNLTPRQELEKIVINTGVGRFCNLPNFKEKILPELIRDVELMTGQHPASRPAKQSIAGFKIREGNVVGLKVTLRGNRMIQFLEKLNQMVLPRIRDFRGISLKSVDVNGNLSFGLKEHTTFPEIIPEQTHYDFGIEITLVPRHKSREEALAFYKNLGLPMEKKH